MIFLKRLMPFILLVMFIFSGSIGLLAGDTPPTEVLNAARKGIGDFKQAETSRIAAGQNSAGFTMVENGEIRDGFQVYTISPNQLVKHSNIDNMLTPTGLWRFVVANEAVPVSLITVALVKKKWTAVSLGGAKLAGEVFNVLQAWPVKDGYTYRFLRIFQTRTDFMQISRNGKPVGFVPLTSSRQAFQLEGAFDPAVLLPADKIEKTLRKMVKENMPAPINGE
ncbi:MAG: hypothetical protein GY765_31540 [bacterium]|nr:hypothetical protein [bacterium]